MALGKPQKITRGPKPASKKSNLMWMTTLNPFRLPHHPTQKVQNSSLGDTWIWDGAIETWTEQNPATSPSPSSAPMAYDAATGTVVLFGGNNGSTQYTDHLAVEWNQVGIRLTQVAPICSIQGWWKNIHEI